MYDPNFSDYVHATEPTPSPVVSMVRHRDGTALIGGEEFVVVLFQ